MIKGYVRVRHRILDLKQGSRDGVPHCGIVYEPKLVQTQLMAQRPFQGWRYLDPADAPPDARLPRLRGSDGRLGPGTAAGVAPAAEGTRPDLAVRTPPPSGRSARQGRFDFLLAGSTGSWSRYRRGASPGPADGPHLPAPSASAEELIAAIGLEPRHAHSGRHLEPLQDLSRSRIDSPQIALVTFPGAVPELSVDPGDPGDEAVGLDGAKNRPCLGIDLMDLPVPILPHPERPFGPREPRVTAAAGRRDRGEHTAGLRIDLLDAILGDLKQVLAVEGRSCMRGDIDRAQRLPARRIEGVQLVSGSKPDVLTVIRDPMPRGRHRKGSILTDDFGR